ncbi:hypothetical protein ACTFIN_01615 [Clostridium cagae]|uniref:hypothetical protein n=1 Tax=Clostridium TaxID=1485 RepID=UPI000540BD14|nr:MULTISPECIES: hypothetical protein [unclassified Clostridium]AIY80659.1 hypothetical protein U728_1678 [Clostridium botulinum 202F]KAI3345011.1 hypothetical protein CIT17_15460 [Clostridium botulinum]KON14096.1 hypothetical protein ACP50_04095 [Clostridium botulinum]MBY6986428.1 hypothetical protein [Clostridium botulinum]MBY7009072.1 hypothetical protein [Clostridium botulinum]
MENSNPDKDIKEFIRILFFDDKGRKPITYERFDKDNSTTIETCGYEDLLLKEDGNKINLYQTSKYLTFYNNKTYEVIKREFMPCVPVCLYLYLKEIN